MTPRVSDTDTMSDLAKSKHDLVRRHDAGELDDDTYNKQLEAIDTELRDKLRAMAGNAYWATKQKEAIVKVMKKPLLKKDLRKLYKRAITIYRDFDAGKKEMVHIKREIRALMEDAK